MARKTHDDALGVIGAETIIGSGVTVKGNLISDADIIVDGTVSGEIKTTGDVTIGVNAQITANISGSNVNVAGTLKGNITATGEATIRETGRVMGDIKALGLAIASGGVFIGHSIMDESPQLDHETADDITENTNR